MDQMAILAVDRDKELRLRELDHLFKLRTSRMSGDVDVVHGLVKNLSPLHEEIVDHLTDRFLVSGDELRAHEHGIAFLKLDVRVLTCGDAHE